MDALSVDEQAQIDLDETRRLLYMAKAAAKTERYNLVGTLANALLHHSRMESDPDRVIGALVAAVEGQDSGIAYVDGALSRVNSLLDE